MALLRQPKTPLQWLFAKIALAPQIARIAARNLGLDRQQPFFSKNLSKICR